LVSGHEQIPLSVTQINQSLFLLAQWGNCKQQQPVLTTPPSRLNQANWGMSDVGCCRVDSTRGVFRNGAA